MKTMRPFARSSTTARGYTAIEVLMAMTVMAIGGAAVITMQKTSVTANLDARRADIANAIARTWVERLRRDAMRWTAPGPTTGNVNNLGNSPILNQVVTAPGQWFLPNQELSGGLETMSPAFDILGRDLPQLQIANADFCVNVRLTWLITNTGVPPGGDLIQADVRVLWPIGILNSFPGFCNPATAARIDPNTDPGAKTDPGADPSAPIFHTLYLTTSVKENAQ